MASPDSLVLVAIQVSQVFQDIRDSLVLVAIQDLAVSLDIQASLVFQDTLASQA